MVKPCADIGVKSAQSPRPCTARPLSRQFGSDPTEWQLAAAAGFFTYHRLQRVGHVSAA